MYRRMLSRFFRNLLLFWNRINPSVQLISFHYMLFASREAESIMHAKLSTFCVVVSSLKSEKNVKCHLLSCMDICRCRCSRHRWWLLIWRVVVKYVRSCSGDDDQFFQLSCSRGQWTCHAVVKEQGGRGGGWAGGDLGSAQGWAEKWEGRVEEMTVMLRLVCMHACGVHECCRWYLIRASPSVQQKAPFSLKSPSLSSFELFCLLQCHPCIFLSEGGADFCGLLFHDMLSC